MNIKFIKNCDDTISLCIGDDTSSDVIGYGIFIPFKDNVSAIDNLPLALSLLFDEDIVSRFGETLEPAIDSILLENNQVVLYLNSGDELFEFVGVKTQEEFNKRFRKRADELLDENIFDLERTGVFAVGE